MTTEIAILSRHAVALAADSAVSTSYKIFPSANKIFTLSKYYPVGIMAYAGASFCGIPIETVIKIYREQLGSNCFDTVENYSDSFIKFLNELDVPLETQQEHVARTVEVFINRVMERISLKISQRQKTEQSISESVAQEVIRDTFKKNFKRLEAFDDLSLASELSFKVFKKDNEDILRQEFKKVENFEEFIPNFWENYLVSAYHLLTKHIFESGYTGIVIAGFGEKDIFPKLRAFIVGGLVSNKLQFSPSADADIDFKNSAEIVPFAQNDVIKLFVEGVAPNYENAVFSLIPGLFNEYKETIVDVATGLEDDKGHRVFNKRDIASVSKMLSETNIKLEKRVQSEIETFKWKTYISPLLQVVGILPKSELALLAETLVNLTSIKRKMSHDEESVGGPTDVAVISKGDGFVWIKRKHYFEPELNHHFFNNYFEE